MKSEAEINEAREKLYKRWKEPGLDEMQMAVLSGMISVFAWMFDSKTSTVFQDVIDGEPFGRLRDN